MSDYFLYECIWNWIREPALKLLEAELSVKCSFTKYKSDQCSSYLSGGGPKKIGELAIGFDMDDIDTEATLGDIVGVKGDIGKGLEK